jgi:hypothetical protein
VYKFVRVVVVFGNEGVPVFGKMVTVAWVCFERYLIDEVVCQIVELEPAVAIERF